MPCFVCIQAYFYRQKQNGLNPFTGGPISWPKALWLSYTILNWFLFPIIILFHPDLSHGIKFILVAHLLSWWIRGSLELVMIYKWFNWSPRYGIAHDFFHMILLFILVIIYRYDVFLGSNGSINFLMLFYILFLFFTTSSEILFANLFLRFRSAQEQNENIYFASDDPKWIFINRVTKVVVTIVFIELIFQSIFVLNNF